MIDFEPPEEEISPGAPAWMTTFADLMALLLCFFVLLLSFSELDVQKYKQVAGSMKVSFGVQNKVKVMDIPKGTSIIAKEFNPGTSKPTPIKSINQFTTETTKPSLRVGNPDSPEPMEEDLSEKTRADAEKLKGLLKKPIQEGKIEIESNGQRITIRIRESGSFTSASSSLDPSFIPTVATLREALNDIEGEISIEGHTDNIPIYSIRFRSNWDLSSSRALSVFHELMVGDFMDETRFKVVGYADTKPRKDNDSPVSRAENRRVEIVIIQGNSDISSVSMQALDQLNFREPDSPTPEITSDGEFNILFE
ncbi:MAG: chemotaxis protein MotB [Alcanivorax sp.]